MLTLIRNAKVFAPEELGVQDVLTADSRILKIAPHIPAVGEYDVRTIDGTGMLLFPGFIDCHVHILGGGGEGSYHTRTPEIMLTDITMGCVTTVVGCLGTDGTTRRHSWQRPEGWRRRGSPRTFIPDRTRFRCAR